MTRRMALSLLGATGLALLLGCGKPKAQELTATEKSEFQAALQDGDPAVIDRLLAAKPGLANVTNDAGETPLKVANRQGNQELADVIKKHGGHE